MQKHGDGVADVALQISDLADFHQRAIIAEGAISITESLIPEDGRVCAAISAFGNPSHILIESNSQSPTLPLVSMYCLAAKVDRSLIPLFFSLMPLITSQSVCYMVNLAVPSVSMNKH
ncbi:MAG: hypothetical protein H7240_03690 [Glaciimonas sp.]|nr:hypothetical protein [Glaciimonas sp.]